MWVGTGIPSLLTSARLFYSPSGKVFSGLKVIIALVAESIHDLTCSFPQVYNIPAKER